MKKLLPYLILFLTATLPVAHAQQKGVAEGRIVNMTDPSIIARGVELEVIELGGGMSIIKSAVSDAGGRFRIEDLPADQKLMIRAAYKGANYHSQVTFSGGTARLEIGVYEPTTSMKDIEVEAIRMAFQVTGDQLKSLETVTFNNKTNPPKTYASPEGNFRISKAPGILEPPKLRVTAPGSSLPLVQSALESADGKSYYSLYPIRPGVTTFEVQQVLPYANRSYSYVKKFFQGASSIDIGVIPHDMVLRGQGISKAQTNEEKNFSIYTSAPVKAGTEVTWEFSGGSPVQGPETAAASAGEDQSEIVPMSNVIGRNGLVLGPLLLIGFVVVLWYAFNRSQFADSDKPDYRIRQVRERKEQLLDSLAELDHRYELKAIGEQEYRKHREEGKRRLRRIALLMKKQ